MSNNLTALDQEYTNREEYARLRFTRQVVEQAKSRMLDRYPSLNLEQKQCAAHVLATYLVKSDALALGLKVIEYHRLLQAEGDELGAYLQDTLPADLYVITIFSSPSSLLCGVVLIVILHIIALHLLFRYSQQLVNYFSVLRNMPINSGTWLPRKEKDPQQQSKTTETLKFHVHLSEEGNPTPYDIDVQVSGDCLHCLCNYYSSCIPHASHPINTCRQVTPGDTPLQLATIICKVLPPRLCSAPVAAGTATSTHDSKHTMDPSQLVPHVMKALGDSIAKGGWEVDWASWLAQREKKYKSSSCPALVAELEDNLSQLDGNWSSSNLELQS